MILFDLSQTLIASLMVTVLGKQSEPINVEFMRHLVLNKLRYLNNQFRKEYYGKEGLVICCDNRIYWRRKTFPYYKAHREDAKEKSAIDWNHVYQIIGMLKDELRNNFPYRLVEVEGAEADDVIGTIACNFGNTSDLAVAEPILIISGDGDFAQLQRYTNVSQFNSVHKKWVRSPDPETELITKIMTGDRGDGIPNILSDDDSIINPDKRQRPLRTVRVEHWIEFPDQRDWTPTIARNFKRNEILIDLRNTPENIKNDIMTAFENKPLVSDRSRIYKYCVMNRLPLLTNHLSDF